MLLNVSFFKIISINILLVVVGVLTFCLFKSVFLKFKDLFNLIVVEIFLARCW